MNASNNEEFYQNSRAIGWREDETFLLIDIWSKNISKLRKMKRNKYIYIKMADEFNTRTRRGLYRSREDLNSKVLTLTRTFKDKHAAIICGCMDKQRPWIFYESINQFLGGSPIHCSNYVQLSLNCGEEECDLKLSKLLTPPRALTSPTSESSKRKKKIAALMFLKTMLDNNEADEEMLMANLNTTILTTCSVLKAVSVVCADVDRDMPKEESNSRSKKVWVKPKKILGWWEDIASNFSNHEWREYFRTNKTTYYYILTELQHFMQRENTNMRNCVSVEKRVAVGLYHMVSACEIRLTAELFGLGISTVHGIFTEFCQVVVQHLFPKHIVFPQGIDDLTAKSFKFDSLLNFPQCVCSIGVCHIPVICPKKHAVNFQNYKGYNSIILFAAVDAQHKFIYINAEYAGSNEDNFILKNSSLQEVLESNVFDCVTKDIGMGRKMPLCIIGDDAFASTRYILTPYSERNGMSEKQSYFNDRLNFARKPVENAFERLKCRFRKISKRVECKDGKFSVVVTAACVLNNICEEMADDPPTDYECSEMDNGTDAPPVHYSSNTSEGIVMRDWVTDFLISNRNFK